MPLLLENAHATALLNRVMNLIKEAVEQLNPNQIRMLTMAQPLSATAREIQWLWPDSFCKKFVILTWEGAGGWGGGGGGLHVEMTGTVVLNSQVQSQLLELHHLMLQNLL